MNNVAGVDVSKGKSMVSVLRPFGEVVAKPFSVGHTGSELKELADYLKSLDGETRVVMEHTGRYYEPVARGHLCQRGQSETHQGLREQHPAQSENRQGGCPEDRPLWA